MNTIAVILAGGEGKRFFPLKTPKSIFPFFSKSIIAYTLEGLSNAGFKKFLVVSSKKSHRQIKDKLGKKKDLKVVIQEEAKGMGNALISAENHLSGKPIFIVNAADLVGQELYDLAFANIEKYQSFIIAKKQEDYFNGGYLKFKKNKLVGIIEKPGEGKQPSKLINLVFHYFSTSETIINQLKRTQSNKDDIYEKAFSQLIKKTKVEVIKYAGYWQPLKYSWDVLQMSKLFLAERLKQQNNASFIAKSAQIDENVYIGKGVRILENAVIKGPSYIGENCVIGTNSLIIESVIERDCIVGFTCEITRSYLGRNTWLHRNYIGDSVLEKDINFGAGAVTANFRFDEKNIHSFVREKKINTKRKKFGAIVGQGSRVGVNSSIMPGVKIGNNSVVGPGVVIYKDLASQGKILIKSATKRLS